MTGKQVEEVPGQALGRQSLQEQNLVSSATGWFNSRFRRGQNQKNGAGEKLRPKREIVNFSCSHRRLLTKVMLVRGALGVCAPARPANSFAFQSPCSSF